MATSKISNGRYLKSYWIYVDCSRAASSRWGYWGSNSLDISDFVNAGNKIISIIPKSCFFHNNDGDDPNILGLLLATYESNLKTITAHVNSAFSANFACEVMVIYEN